MAVGTAARILSICGGASCAAPFTWDAVSIHKGEAILALDTFVEVGVGTDFTCFVALGTFVVTLGSHVLITADTRSVAIVVSVGDTILTLIGMRS